ncbi:unnamed protein product [Staurois parvus]|uniref:Uncharacterized protein n=1 Tax=Staurois parvus TaxID=386267 RepID=A0ABN9AX69_9NEOB|nr:unnamed protein product [Staurois parvus]
MASPHPACARSPGASSTAIRCPLCPPDTVKHQSSDGTSVRGLNHVITGWPISDHMNSSKRDVTS